MKVFNGRTAAEQYMSTHTLTYSTPENTLKKFAYWLGELINVECSLESDQCPNEDGLHPRHRVPRLMAFIENKDIPYTPTEEEDESSFKPSGAVSTFYNVKKLHPEMEEPAQQKEGVDSEKYCLECGTKINESTKFCPQCGTKQE